MQPAGSDDVARAAAEPLSPVSTMRQKQVEETNGASAARRAEPPPTPDEAHATIAAAIRTCLDGFHRYRHGTASETTGAEVRGGSNPSEGVVAHGAEESFEVTCRVLFAERPALLPPFVDALQRGPASLLASAVPPRLSRGEVAGYASRALMCLDPRDNEEAQSSWACKAARAKVLRMTFN